MRDKLKSAEYVDYKHVYSNTIKELYEKKDKLMEELI